MLVGEIHIWSTDKAKGHDSRNKYHLYIGECAWEDGHAFLFINSGKYGSDFELLKLDYLFFPLEKNYISLTGIIPYSDRELESMAPVLKGRLTNQHMKDLFNAVADCKTMPNREVLLVGNALKTAFS
ncbi:MAG: hypothetical protein NTV56_17450 [Alphaproteobacteria bacterium]|nr:hypothetical protein [Alphaproteobacteria bacterium]